ncbi:MAG: hypothetical protein EOP49_04310 [Sphingobacteriales bacterium]|nr:MAG: hypothetical protein EOP49_04310 [Sphingobacteriales bacterium]
MKCVAEYVNMVYYRSLNNTGLYINLYTPSTVTWNGITLTQTTTYPESPDINFTINSTSAKTFSLHFRKPAWLTGVATFRVNGTAITTPAITNGWYAISRKWTNGDKVQITYPMSFELKRLDPVKAYPVALTYGPVVMAAKITDGRSYPTSVYPTPAGSNLTASGQSLVFNAINIPGQVVKPFYNYEAGEPYVLYLDTLHANAIPMRSFKSTGDTGRWWGFAGTTSITTNKPGNAISFTFYGAGLKLTGAKYWDGGQYSVTIDGINYGTIDEYKAGAINQPWEQQYTGLTLGKHSVVLTMLATKTTPAATPYCNFGRSFVLGLKEPIVGTVNSGTYEIGSYITWLNGNSKSLCIAGSPPGMANNAAVVQLGSQANTSVKWNITSLGNGEYKIVNVNSGKALDAGSATAGNLLTQQTPGSGISQKWKIVQYGNQAAYQLIPVKKALKVSVKNASQANGAQIELGTSSNSNSYFMLYNLNSIAELIAIEPVSPNVVAGEKNDAEVKFFTYPNPSSGQFNLKVDTHTDDKVELMIYNFSGKEVYRSTGTGSINTPVDLRPEKRSADHLFIAKMITGGKIYHYKILTP